MNLQELKQKLEKEFSEVMYKCSELHDEFDRLFEQYEKENQASENPLDKYDIQYSPFELVENLRKDMQKEININTQRERELQVQISELQEHTNKMNDEILYLMNKTKDEPKQERFYFKSSESIPSKYIIFDRDNKIMFNYDYSFEAAREACRNLNSLAKGE